MKKAAKLIVYGTVQGVFFRNFLKENAEKFNLKGYTRNVKDSNVEIVVEGDHENIEKFFEIIKKGNAHSVIRDVTFQEQKWQGDFKEFKILKF